MKQLRGVIFDLDGTLLDSMWVWHRIDVDFLKKRGIEATPDYTQAISGMNARQTADYTIRRYALSDTPEGLIEEWNEMARIAYATEVPLKNGAKEWIELLAARGVRMAVATASAEELYLPALRRLGVDRYLSAYACCNEISRGKGFPDIYLLAAERIGVSPEECLVFEDILTGVRGAKAGGFTVCGVYDRAAEHEWEQICAQADAVIEDFSQAMCFLSGEFEKK